MRKSVNIPMRSQLWMTIGFQTEDPRTDIRGTGMLGVLQLAFLVESCPQLARNLHTLSRTQSNSFPLACTGFHFTLACMRALRNGSLNKLVQKYSHPTRAIDLVFVAMCHRFYKTWHKKNFSGPIESIQNFNPVKENIISEVLRRPTSAVEEILPQITLQPAAAEFRNLRWELQS